MSNISTQFSNLAQLVSKEDGLYPSAVMYVRSAPGLVQSAIDDAHVHGATPQVIAVLTELKDAFDTSTNSMIAAFRSHPGVAPGPLTEPVQAPLAGKVVIPAPPAETAAQRIARERAIAQQKTNVDKAKADLDRANFTATHPASDL